MIRAFLAVELGDDLRTLLTQVQQDLKRRLNPHLTPDVRISWVQPSSIHLTVKFLGDTDEGVIEPLRAALAPLVVAHLPIHIPLERLGVFPRAQQPRVLWVGPSEPWELGTEAERLSMLHRAVEECCRSLGFPPEGRPLSPHLTVARIKVNERRVGQAIARSGVLDRPVGLGVLALASLVLMKSELRQSGSVYTPLWRS